MRVIVAQGRYFAVFLAVLIAGCGPRCYLKPGDRVNFYPGYAYPSADKASWQVVVHGQVVGPETQSPLYKTALHAMDAMMLFLPDVGTQSMVFQERMRPFTAEGREKVSVPVELAGKRKVLPKTSKSGYFEDIVKIPIEGPSRSSGWLEVANVPCEESSPRFAGRALTIPEEGLSVVSDIDDTLKITHANNRQELLSNLFMREYEGVPGMAERYSEWSRKGVLFHYVSPSPWQLRDPLQSFLTQQGFPEGTLHLKALSNDEETLSLSSALTMAAALSQSPVVTQTPLIEELLQRFPKRRFILVGNSGQKDPEIYAGLARRYPKQVKAIYIRSADPTVPSTRWRTAFHGLPDSLWQIFSSPKELPSGVNAE